MEEQIIYKAMKALDEGIGLQSRWYASLKDKAFDGRLEIKHQAQKYSFPAVVKKEIKNVQLVSFLHIRDAVDDFIIIADSIFPSIREQLRKMNINYIDGAGNCNIRKAEWIILQEGFKADVVVRAAKPGSFSKTALILIFHLLNDEAYLNETYRQIAEDYDVALGNINNVINNLKKLGYVIRTKENALQLINKKRLLEEWIAGYEHKLKPLLEMGNFKLLSGNYKEWQRIPIKNTESQWGGEAAGNLLTGYLKPGKLMIYTTESKLQLIKKYRLIPDQEGNLSLYKRFWKFKMPGDTVPDVLVYADLINSGDPRNIETASKLYDERLTGKF